MIGTLERYHPVVKETSAIRVHGRVTQIVGLVVEGHGPGATVGEICEIYPKGGAPPIPAEVVGFREGKVLMMPLGDLRGLGPGSRIVGRGVRASARVGPGLLGRVVDGLGQPIDGRGPVGGTEEYPLYARPLNPLERRRIREPLDVGVRAVNGLLTCGKGQRVGILAGSGVGKSVLLGMVARHTEADVNVIGLIGERGREVKEFIEKDLGEAGLGRSVVVAATSDQSPLVRMRGAFLATAIAEYYRDRGHQVMLMMDSLTRFAMAQREVGLAVGEPPATKGYPPSVFALLPRLLERAGTASGAGCITGLYTVLVEADDLTDPVADAVRAILDGHIVLSRDLAAQNHFPAIDLLQSSSRVMIDIVPPAQMVLAQRFLKTLAVYRKAEDLIHIGAYREGTNPQIDEAVRRMEAMTAFLQQGIEERADYQESLKRLAGLFEEEVRGKASSVRG